MDWFNVLLQFWCQCWPCNNGELF